MSILTEEQVYNGTKRLLRTRGYFILAGQPPRGVNHLPVIEVKSGKNMGKGSRDAYKPDLFAERDNKFYLIECKPVYSQADIVKLRSIMTNESRVKSLYDELIQRGLFKKVRWTGNLDDFKKALVITHAYSGALIRDDGICHILVKSVMGVGDIVDLSGVL